jgi:hypothetical protein
MWAHILTIVLFLQLSAHASDFELLQPVNKVSLNCDLLEFYIPHSENLNCTLKDVESSKFEVAVTSDNVDMDVLKLRHYRVNVFITGDEKYPEYFPRHLAKALTGTITFTYTKTPLKLIKRNDLKDFGAKLTILSLRNNKIEAIGYDAFYSLTNLTQLTISNNKLKMLPSNLFANAPVFDSLIVGYNELTELHPDLLKDCPQLTYFDADYNNIENLYENLFKNNPNMTIISMRHNKVKNIAINFKKFEILNFIDFEGNVECDIKYFTDYPDESSKEGESTTIIGTIAKFQKKIEETCRE